MEVVIAALNALVALPKIGDLIMTIIGQVAAWYVQKQTSDTLSIIADAAALSARAKTDEERYAAALKWRDALSRPRYSE